VIGVWDDHDYGNKNGGKVLYYTKLVGLNHKVVYLAHWNMGYP